MPDYSDAAFAAKAADRLVALDGHLLWTGAMSEHGTPTLYLHAQCRSLRRVLWRLAGHALKPLEVVLNYCGVERCVLPAHQAAGRRGTRLTARPQSPRRPHRPHTTHLTVRADRAPIWDGRSWDTAWPQPARAERRECLACNRPTFTPPGYVPHCDRCEDQQYGRLGAQARRPGWR